VASVDRGGSGGRHFIVGATSNTVGSAVQAPLHGLGSLMKFDGIHDVTRYAPGTYEHGTGRLHVRLGRGVQRFGSRFGIGTSAGIDVGMGTYYVYHGEYEQASGAFAAAAGGAAVGSAFGGKYGFWKGAAIGAIYGGAQGSLGHVAYERTAGRQLRDTRNMLREQHCNWLSIHRVIQERRLKQAQKDLAACTEGR
jgi:hypothetical protein